MTYLIAITRGDSYKGAFFVLTLKVKSAKIFTKGEIMAEEVKEVVAQPVVAAPAPVVSACAPTLPASEAPAKAECKCSGTPITSPMVGTFYAASSPEAAPFVEVGKTISKGDTVCIIEAMKLMNEIESEVAGKITEICVKNGDPVEFGQVLMYVE